MVIPPRLRTQEVHDQLIDPTTTLVDVRSLDAYNGWRLRGETRSGHIRGARTLPFKWSSYLDWIEIVRTKEIQPQNTVALYSDDEAQTEQVARLFQRSGFEDVRVYHDFLRDWAADDALPMECLARYRHLVPAEWLHTLLESGVAPEYSNGRYVLCHAHYRNRGDYEQGHIPGAVDLDTLLLESPETWNRRSPTELRESLQTLGIKHDTTVLLYGRFSFPGNDDPFPGSSAGQLAAFRCAFILLYAGVKDVRILNGGLQAWVEARNGRLAEILPVGRPLSRSSCP